MMEHPVTQGSDVWLKLRAGIPTASEFDNLITPEWKARTGQTPQSYLARKLAEAFLGGPLFSAGGSFAMEQGTILEDEARPFYEFTYGVKVRRIGFVTTDDMRVGCSPDGLIGDDSGIEIKCPEPQTHVRYLLDGGLPKDYAAQVHGAMYVTGRPRWVFMSYCRRMPPFVVTVERNQEIQQAIDFALSSFLGQFDAAFTRLCEMGGRKKRQPQPAASAA